MNIGATLEKLCRDSGCATAASSADDGWQNLVMIWPSPVSCCTWPLSKSSSPCCWLALPSAAC